jgi:hypothetical protein
METRQEKDRKEMFEMKRELTTLGDEIQRERISFEEKERNVFIIIIKKQYLEKNVNEVYNKYEISQKERADRLEKFGRSDKKFNQLKTKTNVDLDSSELGLELALQKKVLKNKFLKNALNFLCEEIDELKIITGDLQEYGIEIGDKQLSDKSVSSLNSVVSRSSKRSLKSIK